MRVWIVQEQHLRDDVRRVFSTPDAARRFAEEEHTEGAMVVLVWDVDAATAAWSALYDGETWSGPPL